jgi:hypothetical protein
MGCYYFDIFVTEVQINMTNDFVILTKYWLIIFGQCFLYLYSQFTRVDCLDN